MGFFSDLKDKIFGGAEDEAPVAAEEGEAGVVGEVGEAAADAPAPVAAEPVDLAAQLDALNASHAEDLDWRKLIVDLLKLAGINSRHRSQFCFSHRRKKRGADPIP